MYKSTSKKLAQKNIKSALEEVKEIKRLLNNPKLSHNISESSKKSFETQIIEKFDSIVEVATVIVEKYF